MAILHAHLCSLIYKISVMNLFSSYAFEHTTVRTTYHLRITKSTYLRKIITHTSKRGVKRSKNHVINITQRTATKINTCNYGDTNFCTTLGETFLKIKIYRTIILPVVLYGCETWSLKLREERKLRVCENMVLRRIFGPRRDQVTEEWRRLHNEELNDLYSSPNIVRVIKSKRMRWAGHVARMGEERGCIDSWWGNRRERDHWGDLSVDGWIILG